MSVKLRLIAANIAMVVIPVVICFFFLVILEKAPASFLSDKAVKEFHGTLNFGLTLGDRNAALLTRIEKVIDTKPYLLTKRDYLFKLEQDLKQAPNRAGMIVKQNERVLFVSKELNHPALIKDVLHSGVSKSHIIFGKKQYTLKRFNFLFNNQSAGYLYLLSDITTLRQYFYKISLVSGVILIVSLVISSTILTFFMSKSILQPLSQLKQATQKITDGDLNFQLKSSSNDEFGQLTLAFEEMRARLKNSLETQIRYDNNRKELISAISHDLKTPVTSIKGYVEGIIDGVANSPDKMEKYLKTIYIKINRLDRLIDELFLLSKLDLKKVPFHFERVELGQYLRDCITEYRFEAEIQGIALNCTSLPQSPVWVTADRDQLHRVLVNILDNSQKYTDRSRAGVIVLETIEAPESITVSVRDNGRGVKPEDLPYIFDRFYRADPERNTSSGGTGLGLAIAKLIIEEHGGAIWAESEYGRGTTIKFSLQRCGEPV
jgi:signal transduction histidine kinase